MPAKHSFQPLRQIVHPVVNFLRILMHCIPKEKKCTRVIEPDHRSNALELFDFSTIWNRLGSLLRT